jgi:hypothetical protein
MLTLAPDAPQNSVRHSEMMFIYCIEASPKRIRSSAKNKCEIGGPPFDKTTGFHSFASTLL